MKKIGKPFKFGEWGDIHPLISYEVIEQDAQEQTIEVVEKGRFAPPLYNLQKSL